VVSLLLESGWSVDELVLEEEEERRSLEVRLFYFIVVEECGDVNVVVSL
jgi:hypothetical protein